MLTGFARRIRAAGGAIRGGLLVTGGVAATTVVVIATVIAGGGGGGGSCTGANVTTATFSSRVSGAATNDVLCLNTGSYGTWTGTNKVITVKAGTSQTPTMTLDFGAGTANGFTLDGMTGMSGNADNAVNVTIKNSTFTNTLEVSGTSTSGLVVGPGDTFNWNGDSIADQVACGCTNPGAFFKVQINGVTGTIASPAVKVIGDEIANGDYDGIHIGGDGSTGVDIYNNDLHDICGQPDKTVGGVTYTSNHTDPMQWDNIDPGVTQMRVAGNWIHSPAGCETTGIVSYDAGTNRVLIEDNVIDIHQREAGIELNGDGHGGTNTTPAPGLGSLVDHNTLIYYNSSCFPTTTVCGRVNMASKTSQGDPAGVNTHVFDNVVAEVQFDSGTASGTQDHNLCSLTGCSGTGALTSATPTFVGGALNSGKTTAQFSTFGDYLLSCPGHSGCAAASDGLAMGVTGPAS